MSIRTQAPQPGLLGAQTAGSLVRNVWRVYRHNFFVVLFTFSLIFLPIIGVTALLIARFPDLKNASIVLLFFGYFAAFGPLTITLSDICVGNVPTISRSYGKYFSSSLWLRVVGVVLLLFLYIIVIVLVMFLVFWLMAAAGVENVFAFTVVGVVLYAFMIWLFMRMQFIQTIAILEARSGNDAIRRSFYLTRGQFWRLFGLIMLNSIFVYLIIFIIAAATIGFVVGFVMAAFGAPVSQNSIASILIGGIVNLLFLPLLVLVNILLYYDQRVRRESYDAKGLYEDLMR